jgi:TrmH family RNA methyltransferase
MISSSQNETVKTIRRLRRSKGDHALLEGPHLVREAVAAGLEIDPILVSSSFLESPEGTALAPALAGRAKLVDGRVLDALCDADSPRGILAVARLPRPDPTARRWASGETWLYLDGVQDPGNLGAIARVAEGLGADGLLLSPECAHPNHPRALRASAGSLLRLPVIPGFAADEARRWSAGATWIGLDAHAGTSSLRDLAPRRPFVLAVGAEGRGLSPATQERIDHAVTLPTRGRVESLNVAVATALALAELLRDGSP